MIFVYRPGFEGDSQSSLSPFVCVLKCWPTFCLDFFFCGGSICQLFVLIFFLWRQHMLVSQPSATLLFHSYECCCYAIDVPIKVTSYLVLVIDPHLYSISVASRQKYKISGQMQRHTATLTPQHYSRSVRNAIDVGVYPLSADRLVLVRSALVRPPLSQEGRRTDGLPRADAVPRACVPSPRAHIFLGYESTISFLSDRRSGCLEI